MKPLLFWLAVEEVPLCFFFYYVCVCFCHSAPYPVCPGHILPGWEHWWHHCYPPQQPGVTQSALPTGWQRNTHTKSLQELEHKEWWLEWIMTEKVENYQHTGSDYINYTTIFFFFYRTLFILLRTLNWQYNWDDPFNHFWQKKQTLEEIVQWMGDLVFFLLRIHPFLFRTSAHNGKIKKEVLNFSSM